MLLDYGALLSIDATLFLLLAAGFVAKKARVIDEVSTKKLSAVIVKIGQPFLLISSLISLDFSTENLKMGLLTLALSFGLHVFMATLAFLFSKGFRKDPNRSITEFALIFTNCGFIGFPIINSIYGEKGLFCGAFYLVGFHLFLWTWGVFVLSRGREDIKLTPKKIFINYGTIPSLIGIILFLLPFRMPTAVITFSQYLAGLCTPVSLLITGALIASRSPKLLFGKISTYIVSALKLIVIPMITACILRLLGLDPFFIVFGTVMAALPTASVVSMFSELYSMDSGYSSQLVGITTLFSVGTLPLLVLFAQFISTV
ncbi:MAG: AEC family transporter [Clostridia bacterium]|nr:AEC family transporter [Clostridia bacterium]